MKDPKEILGIEINPKFVGAFFTERAEQKIRVFCFFTNGSTSQFDMPADGNLDTLQRFHSKLNMDESCFSVILDEVVQGRVYVRSEENHCLYTLLTTPGNVLPLFDAGIGDLPWKYCWRSLAVDILEYGETGDPEHCFAIRTQIGQSDALRLVRDSGAFTNPVYKRKKRSPRRLYLTLGLGLALLASLLSFGIFQHLKQIRGESFQPFAMTGLPAESNSANYYLLCKRQIIGPFPLKSIATMNAGGMLAAETLCRPENSLEWISLPALLSAQPPNQI